MNGFSTVKVFSRFLLFWLTLFSSFDYLSKDSTLTEIINMPVKEIDGSVLEGVSLLFSQNTKCIVFNTYFAREDKF